MSRIGSALLPSALVLSLACTGALPSGPSTELSERIALSVTATRAAGGSCVASIANFNVSFPTITFDLNGECQLRHLGRSTLVAHETVLLLGPTFSTGSISRSGTYTAANGDVLNFTFSGTATISATGVAFEGTETYVSGTGRFAGVSGSTAQEGTSDGVSVGQYTLKGSISY